MRPYSRRRPRPTRRWRRATWTGRSSRPGRLTNDPGTGQVQRGAARRPREITRDDVAAVLAACLDEPRTVRATFELLQGDTPIAEALRRAS